MKKLSLIALCLFVFISQAQTITSSKNHLEPTKPCKCVDLSLVTNQHTPADILKGVEKCVNEKKFVKAAKLFALASVYGKFDTYRVKNKASHQALFELQQNTLMNIDETETNNFINALDLTLKKKSYELKELCKSIKSIGFPQYYPKYMTMYGSNIDFNEDINYGLLNNFDSESSWKIALIESLDCNN